MPQLQPTKDGRSPIAPVVKENKPFRVRLRDRYKPTDYVRVINIDNEPCVWQYFPVDGEETYFSDDGVMRMVSGRQHFDEQRDSLLPGNDQAWIMNPGESEVLLGANADLFIEMLYKTLVAKSAIEKQPEIGEGRARKYNWNDGALQERMIDRIFLGIETPQFGAVDATKSRTAAAAK